LGVGGLEVESKDCGGNAADSRYFKEVSAGCLHRRDLRILSRIGDPYFLNLDGSFVKVDEREDENMGISEY
jgi:hypothetical protein